MKKRKQVKKRGKVGRLRASADGEKLAPGFEPWRKYFKARKELVTLRLDADILAWFKEDGPGYQTRINRALQKLMREAKNE